MRLHFFKKYEQLFNTGKFFPRPIVVKADGLLYSVYEPGCSTPTVH